MDLAEYIAQQKGIDPSFTQGKFSYSVGSNPTSMTKIIRAQTIPSLRVAMSIEEATEGRVKGWDLMTKAYKRKQEKKK